jgi:hypothetical protein
VKPLVEESLDPGPHIGADADAATSRGGIVPIRIVRRQIGVA